MKRGERRDHGTTKVGREKETYTNRKREEVRLFFGSRDVGGGGGRGKRGKTMGTRREDENERG